MTEMGKIGERGKILDSEGNICDRGENIGQRRELSDREGK